VARHLPKQPQRVACPFHPSFPCLSSLGGCFCCHRAVGRLGPLAWPRMALISSSAQAAATGPGSQLESLSNATGYKAVFCQVHGLVLITTGSTPRIFFFYLNHRAFKASCVFSCNCHHTSTQCVPWHVREHSWVSMQNQRYLLYRPVHTVPTICQQPNVLPFLVEDQRVYLNASNSTFK